MSDRITKLQRWLDLIAFLVRHRRPVTVDEIMEGVPAYARKWIDRDDSDHDAVRRMFERDKAELKAFGIPLRTRTWPGEFGADVEGYVLARRDFYLPYLRLVGDVAGADPPGSAGAASGPRRLRGVDRIELDDEDAASALDALSEATSSEAFPFAREARSAFRKLSFDLDPDALLDDGSPVLFVDRPGAAEVAATVRTLSDALLARKRVRFRYHGLYRGETTERHVEPYGLLFQRAHWYLIGHDLDRDGRRVFRVGRMEDVERNKSRPRSPDYEIPDDFDASDHLGREAWELGDDETEPPVRAHVLFRFPASLWADRNGKGELVEERSDGSALRAFEVQQPNPFLRWLLTFEGEAEVLEPAELKAELVGMAREVAAMYGGSDAETETETETEREAGRETGADGDADTEAEEGDG
ncbi:MAG: helix-turn-helix transcriptional regulator [Gemmatimonadota bacterium]